MRRQLFRRTLFVLAVAFTFTLVSPVADTLAKPGGGNSANAKACQKGGWAALAREGSPTVAFQNQDECVSYGAQGGTLVPQEPLNPVVTVSFTFAGVERGTIFCYPNIQLSGFQPNTSYTAFITVTDGFRPIVVDRSVTTDSNGHALLIPFSLSIPNTVEAKVDGVSSGTSTMVCSAP